MPVLFQRVTTSKPLTLILSASQKNGPSISHVVIPVSSSFDWIISQRKALMGWVGSSVTVDAYSTLKFWGNAKVSGTAGQVALVGEGQVYQIEIQQGESIRINPANVIAYTVSRDEPESFRQLTKISNQSRVWLELPKLSPRYKQLLPELSWIRQLNVRQYIPIVLTSSINWLKTRLITFLWKHDVALKLSGPRTIVIQSIGSELSHVFTKQELQKILLSSKEKA